MKFILVLLIVAAFWMAYANTKGSGFFQTLHLSTANTLKENDHAQSVPPVARQAPVTTDAPPKLLPSPPPTPEPAAQPKKETVTEKPDVPNAEELVSKLDNLLNDIKKK